MVVKVHQSKQKEEKTYTWTVPSNSKIGSKKAMDMGKSRD
jgi:hypothetical protein